MHLSVQRKADVPIYRQIVNQIRDQIRLGTLPTGTRLPPVRQLAAAQGLTRLTVHSAYSELQAQGLVESHVGRGTYVAAVTATPPPGQQRGQVPTPWASQGVLAELLRVGNGGDLLSFAQAFPDPHTYPAHDLARAIHSVIKEPSALAYGHSAGDPQLRIEIADLSLQRGVSVPPDHVLVTAGAQQAIDVVLRALTERGDVVLVEEPVYPGILELAALGGQRVIGVPNRDGELDLDALEEACAVHKPRLLYLVPAFSNPTGRSLLPQSRAAVLRLAAAHDFLVLEDDTYGFLGFDDATPPSLMSEDTEERVIYITGFSKSLAPALRLGALIAPTSFLPALAGAKQSSDLVCSALLQRALAEYLRGSHYAAHLRSVRALYRERRDAMLEALQRHLPQCSWSQPDGGLSLWVSLPQRIVERDFTTQALEAGIGITPGAAFFSGPQPVPTMRLSYSSQSPQRIEEGVETLGKVLETNLSRRSRLWSMTTGAAGPLV